MAYASTTVETTCEPTMSPDGDAYDSAPDDSYQELHDPADYAEYLERHEMLYRDYHTADNDNPLPHARAPKNAVHRVYSTAYAGEADTTTRNHFTIGIDTSREYRPPDDLIDGLIPRVSRCGIVGASGSGKSFVLGQLAASLGKKLPFAGRDVLRQGGFGYFSYEASGTLEPRWRGLERKYPGMLSDDSGIANIPYFPVARPLSLDTDRGWRAMDDTIKRMEDVCWDLFDMPLVAVAIDTVHASQMVAKENDSDAWAKPLEWMLELSEEHKLAFIISHHSGKTSDAPDGRTTEGSLWRGSGAAPAALDSIIAIKMNKREGKVTRRWAYLEKSKDGETGYICDIATKVHTIGRKSNGKPITTLTLDFIEKSEDDQKTDRARDIENRKTAVWKPTEPAKRMMKAIRKVAEKECRAVKLSSGKWSYTASQNEVETVFRSEASSNATRDLRRAKIELTDKAGLAADGTMMTYELTTEKPIPIGAFS